MKTLSVYKPLTSLILILINVGTSVADCTESEAYNQMMALGRAQSQYMASGSKMESDAGTRIAIETAEAGKLLAAKQFSKACKVYQAIAKKYDVDLKEEKKGLVTIQELKKDGGKGDGECGIAEASQKMMGMHQQLQTKVDAGIISSNIFRDFGNDTTKISELMYTNPSEACKKLDELKPKYGIE